MRWQNIESYGLIGNCRAAALVSNRGSIDWCCLPRFDSPSFFAALLDPNEGGSFSIMPSGEFESRQTYVSRTNVLCTEFFTADARATLEDCFTAVSEQETKKSLWPNHEILRVIKARAGEMTFRLKFSPRANYGVKQLTLRQIGSWGLLAEHHCMRLLLQMSGGIADVALDENGGKAEFTVQAGETFCVSLTYADVAPGVATDISSASERLEMTKSYWRKWLSHCAYDGPYKEHVYRSALALKLLSFAPSGAIVAAPTTSLPEWLGSGRNWDYRFCWLRDASFTTRALTSLGYWEEAKAFVSWLLHSTRLSWPKLDVMYTVYGGNHFPEKVLSHLTGYKRSRPVRIGNAANQQFQLDIYGEVMDGLYRVAEQLDHLDHDTVKIVKGMADTVCESWGRPDEGIWEIRKGRSHNVHSKVMAWVTLDRACKIALKYRLKLPVEKYEAYMTVIRSSIETYGFDERLRFYQRSFEEAVPDASVLVMPIVGYCSASGYRMRKTIGHLKDTLSCEGLIWRYPPQSDGFETPEGAFGLCTFWMVEALVLADRLSEAERWFASLLERANGVGLWSEEIDPASGAFLGNYPQAFSHVGLVNAANSLTQALERKAVA